MEAVKDRFTIKELPEEERPREKLLAKGAKYLSNAELLALIIRTGSKEKTAVELAQLIINYFGGLKGLINLSCEELETVKGVGRAKAAQISALIELSKRISQTKAEKGELVFTPSMAADLLMEDMRHLEQEVVKAILLDVKSRVIKISEITKGGLSSSIVHPRDVFKEAIRKNSAAIILAHNHPSGEPTPSPEDINISKKIAKSGTILGIELVDHIIIGDGKYISLKEEDKI